MCQCLLKSPLMLLILVFLFIIEFYSLYDPREEYDGGGETSIPTAFGVLCSIRAAAQMIWQDESLVGRRFAIQGLGKVGFKVAELYEKFHKVNFESENDSPFPLG